MSKRHQSSRRKTYGRRQHEVRERHDRGPPRATASTLELERLGLGGARPIRSPSSTRARRASASRSATDRWPSTRAHALAPSRCRAAPRTAEAPDARLAPPCRAAVRARPTHATASACPRARSSSRSCSRSSRSRSTSACRPRATTSAASQLERERLDARPQDLRRTSTGSAASRPSASSPSTPASASWASRSSSRRADRSTERRCWVGPIPAAASSSCSSSSPSARSPWSRRTAYWQVVQRRRCSPAEAAAQTTVRDRDRQPARRHLRPDRHRRAGHDRRARPARRRARPADARERTRRPATS